jgi:hypothetical protein
VSAEDRRQPVTALTVMIREWWLGNLGRSADAVRRSDQSGGPAAGELRRAGQGMRRRTAVSVTIGP